MTVSAPVALAFEYRPATEPALGLGTAAPRLTWHVPAAPSTWVQEAAEFEVTRTPWGGEAVTSQHTVAGSDQTFVGWPAAPLVSRERASVRVRVSGGGETSDWSAPAVVEAGLLEASDWGAEFVSPVGIAGIDESSPALVSSFQVDGPPTAARLHITAHGWYEVHLNGVRVSDDYFGPGWTVYPKRLRYYTYDVTGLVREGENEVAVLLGNGWWRGRLTWLGRQAVYGDRLGAMVRLDVATDAGTSAHVTGSDWRAVETHITADDMYMGQDSDLTRPLLGTESHPVEPVDVDLDTLVAAVGPAVRAVEQVAAQQVWRSPSGKLLVDFGQNLVGFTRLTVRGLTAGTRITLKHAEVLEHDELGTRPLRSAKATDTYLVAGAETEVLEPRFTFHGFRYAEVEGVDDLDPADITAVVTFSDMARTGWFECSEPLVNRLHENTVWGMKGNFVDVPTDCPQRDERLGWTGDIQVFSPAALFLHDAVGFLSNWTDDLAAEQHDDGTVPIIVPDVLGAPFAACAWGDAAVVVPWNLYLATGDASILARQLGSMKGWVDKISSLAGESRLWLGGFQFGDWLDPAAPPESPAAARADADVVASACYFHCADLTAKAAAVVGDEEAAATYGALAAEVREAFRRRFVTSDGHVLSDAPTVYSQAIVWGLLDDEQLPFAGARLADLLRLESFRISTGFVGTPLISDALTMTGQAAAAYALLLQTQCPSWLYSVTMGATTIWERYDSMLPDGTINPGEMTSFNHYALGAVVDWLHRVVAGLQVDVPSRRVTAAPVPGGRLTYAKASLDTLFGTAATGWTSDGTTVTVELTVPVGMTGAFALPGSEVEPVGSGTHTRTFAAPQAPAKPTTVRELLDSDVWPQVAGIVTEAGLATGDQALATRLKRHLGASVQGDALVQLVSPPGFQAPNAGLAERLAAVLA